MMRRVVQADDVTLGDPSAAWIIATLFAVEGMFLTACLIFL